MEGKQRKITTRYQSTDACFTTKNNTFVLFLLSCYTHVSDKIKHMATNTYPCLYLAKLSQERQCVYSI